jgi:hypothetical protein
MKQDKPNSPPSRRMLLRSLAVGGGAVVAGQSMPAQWARPVVDSVVLPAHAETSPGETERERFVPAAGTVSVPGEFGKAPERSRNRLARLVESIVPKAHAFIPYSYYLCVDPSADGASADVRVYQSLFGACEGGGVVEKWLHKANVGVPGDNPLSGGVEVCGGPSLSDNLLNRLGIIRSAHAAPVPTISVELDSVENGASGRLVIGGQKYPFDIGPGECASPDCCSSGPEIPQPPPPPPPS